MSKLMPFCCAVLLLCFQPAALGATPDKDKGKPPRVTLNENDTPLDRLIEKAKKHIDDTVAARKIEEAKEDKRDCADAELLPDDDDKPGKKAKACKVMQFKKGEDRVKGPSELLKDAHGAAMGKRVKTRTKLVVDHPSHLPQELKGPRSNWDELGQLRYQRRPNLEFAGLPANAGVRSQAANIRIRTAKLPGSEARNDDKDCIDTATGQRHGGWVRDADGNPSPNPDSCFDETGLVLKTTLTRLATGECAHANGKLYTKEECDKLEATVGLTSLEELIDEDGPNGLDDDQDGFVDEDGPELGTEQSLCRQQGGEVIAGNDGESCDFTKEVRRRAQAQFASDQPRGKKKLFKINDATGECDSSDTQGEFACGEEPREIEIEETMELSCPPGGIMEDDRCLIPPKGPQGQAALAYVINAAGSDTVVDYAMMGFTFAPPVLKWGINEVEKVCFFGWCFEIFALRFGYEFEVAAGLRLPAKLTVTDIPTPHIVAEQDASLTASLEAADFKVKDYVDFCHKHNLDSSWYISDCERFAFPEYFESMAPDSFFPGGAGGRQGQEFVAQTTIFAGLVIRVFSIPVVNFGVDSGVNVPAMCTLFKLKNQLTDDPMNLVQLLADFGKSVADTGNLMTALEQNLINCSSFTTPWGNDEKGQPRQFPFATASFQIPADCLTAKVEAMATGVAVGGDPKPICSGLSVNIYGATLGLGLELAPYASSDLIKAKATTTGDARDLLQDVDFRWGAANPSIGPVRFDNYDRGSVGDKGIIQFDDFNYCLNQLGVQVNGLIELGGLLAFIGNVATIPLVTVTFGLPDCGLPIPQHPGTGPITIEVPVANYALTVDVKPDVLLVKPGTPATYEVWLKNEGTVPDTLDNFGYALSNRPQSSAPYEFGIYPNTDFDCVDGDGKLYFGYPFDGLADNCYNADGTVRADRTEVVADDSVGVWAASFGATSIANVPAHSVAATPVSLTVSPYRHPLTKPGDYPVRVTADSRTARNLKLAAVDPANVPRLGAEKVVTMRIESFFEPQLTVTPAEAAVQPRGSVTFTVEAANYGNDLDQFTMQTAFAESDTAGCTLTTNGSGTQCPYRALITRIDPAGWTNVADLDPLFPPIGLFQPLARSQDTFTITAPPNWAGMQDTLYTSTFRATCSNDRGSPNLNA